MPIPTEEQIAQLFAVHNGPERRQTLLARQYGFDTTSTWKDSRGYTLSTRVWRARKAVRDQIDQILRDAIANGTDALEIADILEQFLDPEFAPVRNAAGKLIRNQAKGIVTEWPGRSGYGSFAARRLARTEITRALGMSTIQTAASTPFARGVKWNLSARHPKPDECCVPGTMIETMAGPRSIESIHVGDWVLTDRMRYRQVTRLHRNATPAGSLVQLRCQVEQNRTFSVTLTPNHPVLTDQGWQAAGTLNGESQIVALTLSPSVLVRRLHSGGHGKAVSGFVGTETLLGLESIFAERHDGDVRSPNRTRHSDYRTFVEPIAPRRFAFGMCRWLNSRLPSSGYPLRVVTWRMPAGFRPVACTGRDGVSRNWDWPRLSLGRTPSSSIAVDGMPRTMCHRSRIFSVLRRGIPGSRRLSKIADLFGVLAPGSLSRKQGRLDQYDSASPAPRTNDCKTGASRNGSDGPCQTPEVEYRSGTTRTVSAYVDYTVPGDDMPFVYNLSIAEDQSYFANGIAVHNCDDNARRSSPGLPPGVYTPGDVPRYPSHPADLCNLSIDVEPDTDSVIEALRARYGLDQ